MQRLPVQDKLSIVIVTNTFYEQTDDGKLFPLTMVQSFNVAAY